MKHILVTGAAGFIGSHLVERLLELDYRVTGLDNLSAGRIEYVKQHQKNNNFKFTKLDLLDERRLAELFSQNNFSTVFHLAANSNIQKGMLDLDTDLNDTFLSTVNLVKAMRQRGAKEFIFTSSSAVFGMHRSTLTEKSSPLLPQSFYGAAKLAGEGYISAASTCYGIKSWIVRLPNVVGERSTHGVVHDFMNKLKQKPEAMKILGDGFQRKPYIYVKDVVAAIIYVWQNATDQINVYNLGVKGTTSVRQVAAIVCREMGQAGTRLDFTGGKVGWIGDIPYYRYDGAKLRSLGWRCDRSSSNAVRMAVKSSLKYPSL